jgi:hypothetical protein
LLGGEQTEWGELVHTYVAPPVIGSVHPSFGELALLYGECSRVFGRGRYVGGAGGGAVRVREGNRQSGVSWCTRMWHPPFLAAYTPALESWHCCMVSVVVCLGGGILLGCVFLPWGRLRGRADGVG